MSVTIVSTPPPANVASQANGAELAAGISEELPGSGFADILLVRQILNIPVKANETVATGETDSELSPTVTGEVDTTAMLAALGLATLQPATPNNTVEQPLPGTGKTGDSSISLTQSGVTGEKSLSTETLPQATLPNATAGVDDKPAKFAVASSTAASSDNALKAEPSQSADAQPKGVSALMSPPSGTLQNDAPLAVKAHVRDPSWSAEFSQKIVWLTKADKQSAQLTLNPPQMGPIEISLSVEKGSASASFVSPNQEVRDAIETALPRLREMFASAGIQLGQTNVSSDSFRQQSENNAGNLARQPGHAEGDILAGASAGSLTTGAFSGQTHNGLVDLFA